jgi:hypothetical protein
VIDKKVIVIAGLFFALIVALIIMAIVGSSPSLPSGSTLSARYNAFSELVKYNDGGKVVDSGLKKALVEADLVVASSKYQLSKIVTLDAKDGTVPAGETQDFTTTLNQSIASGSFNRQYSTLLINQISKIVLSLQEVRSEITNQTSISTIDSSIQHLTEISNRFTNN